MSTLFWCAAQAALRTSTDSRWAPGVRARVASSAIGIGMVGSVVDAAAVAAETHASAIRLHSPVGGLTVDDRGVVPPPPLRLRDRRFCIMNSMLTPGASVPSNWRCSSRRNAALTNGDTGGPPWGATSSIAHHTASSASEGDTAFALYAWRMRSSATGEAAPLSRRVNRLSSEDLRLAGLRPRRSCCAL